MTVSMWNTALGWNGLNKSESLMTLITKVNLIQIGPFQAFKTSGLGAATKNVMLVLEKWDLERELENV